jgi:hypothetical protein
MKGTRRMTMPKTRTGKRSAKISGQIVEETDGSIYLWLDGTDAPAIYFSRKTGHSGSKAHEKLLAVLDAEDAAQAAHAAQVAPAGPAAPPTTGLPPPPEQSG